MATLRLVQNIAGRTSKSDIAKVGHAYTLNMYQETQSDDKSCTILNRYIPGMTLAAEIDGTCRGMYRMSKSLKLYAVYGEKLYYIDEEHNVFEIGNIDSKERVSMCETGGYDHPHLIIADGLHLYAVDTSLPVEEQRLNLRLIKLPIRKNGLSIEPTHCAYLYGYLIINDKGTDAFYTSYQYPFESYAPNELEYNDLFRVNTDMYKDYGFITYAEWQPDNIVAISSNGSRLYTFGTRSYQIFSYNNDINFPFTSPNNAAGNIGIKSAASLAVLGDTIMWLGSSDIGENGIFMLKNDTINRVSDNDLERYIANLANAEDSTAMIWQEQGHTFYAINLGNETWVYDISENAWHNRKSGKNKWRYNFVTFAYGKNYFGTKDALVYSDVNKFTEHDGAKILKLRRGAIITNQDLPFFIDALSVITNNGQTGGFDGEPKVYIRYQWDGSIWSDYELGYTGKTGQYDYETTFYGLGMGKYFTLEISTTDPVPFTIQNLKLNWTGGSNF